MDAPNVHVGALKPAEDGDGCILRLVEQHGGRGEATVRMDRAIADVQECDLLERAERAVGAGGREFTVSMRPFEIKTLRLRFA